MSKRSTELHCTRMFVYRTHTHQHIIIAHVKSDTPVLWFINSACQTHKKKLNKIYGLQLLGTLNALRKSKVVMRSQNVIHVSWIHVGFRCNTALSISHMIIICTLQGGRAVQENYWYYIQKTTIYRSIDCKYIPKHVYNMQLLCF